MIFGLLERFFSRKISVARMRTNDCKLLQLRLWLLSAKSIGHITKKGSVLYASIFAKTYGTGTVRWYAV